MIYRTFLIILSYQIIFLLGWMVPQQNIEQVKLVLKKMSFINIQFKRSVKYVFT